MEKQHLIFQQLAAIAAEFGEQLLISKLSSRETSWPTVAGAIGDLERLEAVPGLERKLKNTYLAITKYGVTKIIQRVIRLEAAPIKLLATSYEMTKLQGL